MEREREAKTERLAKEEGETQRETARGRESARKDRGRWTPLVCLLPFLKSQSESLLMRGKFDDLFLFLFDDCWYSL